MKSQKQTPLTTEYLDEKLSVLISYMDVRFEKIESRLDKIEVRLDKIEARLDKIEERLDDHDIRFTQIDERFNQIDKQLVNINERLDSHEERFDRLEKHIDFKFDFFKEDIIRSLEPMFADMRIDLLGYKDSMVSRTMDIEVEQVASTSIAKRNQDLICDHEERIKKLEAGR
ncbi:hypothetical protein CO058_00425 [candidate division WWE3 bacterium CG_4_9_14_0_2_um_filter_35_11]|uniref:ABC transporter Uup C-terminal domain-containing protein n=1 Tax=candidate division WWE3 bacterium CG_4_9_14_0_2_um_filter_35_11 TaxID=1975077 RepID=A0A2M8EMN3_UNCKA|nr:MAG: hypothetical protein CO058_00425 [candidate division WWE3 bacterium CG_4_9_14_0_2_um_filter_35_11]